LWVYGDSGGQGQGELGIRRIVAGY